MEHTIDRQTNVDLDHVAYHGKDLGVTFKSELIRLRVWSPVAEQMTVKLYRTARARKFDRIELERAEKGTWMVELDRAQFEGQFYVFEAIVDGKRIESLDPYAKVVGVNGKRGCLLDPSSINPDHWVKERPLFHSSQEAVIYEAHVRDLTSHPDGGVMHRGKFLGMTEAGTKTKNGYPTALDYITALGVTHLQLMPFFDYGSVNESRESESNYNWGYDPVHYFAVEGSYASTADDPAARILELKAMVQALHDRGIRVIMDVVFNHTYDALTTPLGQFVPDYYYRLNEDGTLADGSECGNDTASERAMMRKLIVECVSYWAKEFMIDGFRFDLMGLHDVKTMNQVRKALDRIDPSILVTGEGWDLDTPLAVRKKANQHNAHKMPRIAQFNDAIRDGIRGDVFIEDLPGWISGNLDVTADVKRGIAGAVTSQSFADEPNQVVNYVECHDNLTLWDKLAAASPDDNETTRRRRHRLATTIVLLSQGIPFLHSGQEFFRTKDGDENSFKSGEVINRLDWTQAEQETPSVEYVKGLINLRKQYPLFRLENTEQIRKHLRFFDEEEGVIAYELHRHVEGYVERHLVYHNGLEVAVDVKLPAGKFEVHVEDHTVNLTAPRLVEDRHLTVAPLSTLVVTERRPDYSKYAVAGGAALAILGLWYVAKKRKNKQG
ncbi:type I pullulanase [Exiguobacterium sp. SH3S2]|uniref:type I pullulanase n=1 Tax=unclassified Exiguobacterium TaxID=2644629 RepID=UPI00103A219A|nr:MULTISPECIES: type I pullulanase [unclassified Exiguobacterium]TCI47209.1 type I pullulanase [Exiguobacterium sp. SH3S3]TCI62284.1 type I pullulanase [Exiguobacterium sp. SH3S1]TCI62357.1 type I pullulanase [Exiguobacterium sp. SH3S2]